MIDNTLLGAVERAIERKERRESIIESLSYLGYSQAEIEEAINKVSQKEELPLEEAPEQEAQVTKQIKEKTSPKEFIISALIAGSVLIICVVAFLVLRAPVNTCKTALGTQLQNVIGLNISCNIIKTVNIQSIIIFSVVLIVFLISLLGKKLSR